VESQDTRGGPKNATASFRNSGVDTVSQLPKKRSRAAHLERFRFKKGNDARRNRSGRPQSFEQFRKLCQRVLAENVQTKSGERITAAEQLVRKWLHSNEPAAQRALAEYAFGKVPDKLETTGLENKVTLILHHAHERRDAIADSEMPALPAHNGTLDGQSKNEK
jgi:hypothetical protein